MIYLVYLEKKKGCVRVRKKEIEGNCVIPLIPIPYKNGVGVGVNGGLEIWMAGGQVVLVN
jgi:hypothetical protein